MSKPTQFFACTNCDAQFTKWTGRCLECGKWGTVVKSQMTNDKYQIKSKGQNPNNYPMTKTVALHEIKGSAVARLTTNIGELDRVLGGGIVPGSLVLLGGEPGIGKSTLALQLATAVSGTLYLSAEESIEQIKLRADRLKINSPTLRLGNATNVEEIVATIRANATSANHPSPLLDKEGITTVPPPARGGAGLAAGGGGGSVSLAIIDSIQTISSPEVEGEPGGVNQIRASTVKLLEVAKATGTTVVLISHVTKDGLITGPKTLEHLVDTVLYLEGDRHHLYRILRTVKNRFGATDEVGVFAMEAAGLVEVKNPSANFIEERGENTPGNILTCLMEGTRPILVEVQALVSKTAFGYPTRKASGFDINRLHVLIAVLQKRAGLHLEQYDVHINVVGGLQADEPAADLAIAMAIASAYKDKTLGADLAVFGEVGLGGEVRPVANAEKRIKECERLGLKRVITNPSSKFKVLSSKLRVITVKNIQELIKHT